MNWGYAVQVGELFLDSQSHLVESSKAFLFTHMQTAEQYADLFGGRVAIIQRNFEY